ncbi:MAG: preprotein translocase subunit YajC [Bacteroidota bacterium]
MLNNILLQAQGMGYQNFIMIGGMIVIFYFFFIRPQQKKQKDQKNFINEVSKGDKVVTIGGIHGKIHSLDDTTMVLELDKGFKMTVEKSSISFEATKRVNGESAK